MAPIIVALGKSSRNNSRFFPPNRGEHERNARYVACWAVKARDETKGDRVAAAQEDNWNGLSCCLGCERSREKGSGNDCRSMADQVRRQRRQTIVVPFRPPVFDRDVSALDDPSLTQALAEGIRQREWVRRALVEKAYQREWRLRGPLQWPRDSRAAKKDDECSTVHY